EDVFVREFGRGDVVVRGRGVEEVLGILCGDDEGYHEEEGEEGGEEEEVVEEDDALGSVGVGRMSSSWSQSSPHRPQPLRPNRPSYITLPPPPPYSHTPTSPLQSPTTGSAPDIWHDAQEFFLSSSSSSYRAPMSPVRSAADLQQLLRVSSGRSLASFYDGGGGGSASGAGGGVGERGGRVRSSRSLRSLAGLSMTAAKVENGVGSGERKGSKSDVGGGGKKEGVAAGPPMRVRKRDVSVQIVIGVVRKLVDLLSILSTSPTGNPVSPMGDPSSSSATSTPTTSSTTTMPLDAATRKAKASAVLTLHPTRKSRPSSRSDDGSGKTSSTSSLIIFESDSEDEDEDEIVDEGMGRNSPVTAIRKRKRLRRVIARVLRMHPWVVSVVVLAVCWGVWRRWVGRGVVGRLLLGGRRGEGERGGVGVPVLAV
ncbi:hypothetical protein HDV00_006083, partial [Rhizophlyctis rosea]